MTKHKDMFQRYLLIPLLTAGLFGCASNQLRVESDPPEAHVVLSVQGQSPRTVGVTPITIPLPDKMGFEILVQKEGYFPNRVILPAGPIPAQSEIFVSLDRQITQGDDRRTELLQRVAQGVAEAKSLIDRREYDLAEMRLRSLSDEYPSVSVFQDLLGNVYFLKRDFSRALAAYRRSENLNPDNPDTKNMIRRIESLTQAGGGE